MNRALSAPAASSVPLSGAEKVTGNLSKSKKDAAVPSLDAPGNQNVPMLPNVSSMPGQIGGIAGDPSLTSGPVGEATIRNLVASMKGKIVKTTESADPAKAKAKTILVSVPGDNADLLVTRLRAALSVLAEVGDPYDIPVGSTEAAYAANSDSQGSSKPETRAALKMGAPPAAEEAEDISLPDLQSQMLLLKRRKAELLAQFFEDAKPVQEVEGQIKDLQKRIDGKAAADKKATKKPKFIQIVIGGW
jgi:hypothetical protein